MIKALSYIIKVMLTYSIINFSWLSCSSMKCRCNKKSKWIWFQIWLWPKWTYHWLETCMFLLKSVSRCAKTLLRSLSALFVNHVVHVESFRMILNLNESKEFTTGQSWNHFYELLKIREWRLISFEEKIMIVIISFL